VTWTSLLKVVAGWFMLWTIFYPMISKLLHENTISFSFTNIILAKNHFIS